MGNPPIIIPGDETDYRSNETTEAECHHTKSIEDTYGKSRGDSDVIGAPIMANGQETDIDKLNKEDMSDPNIS